MEPNRVGRILGTGTRVAAGMLRERAASAASGAATGARKNVPVYAEHSRRAATGAKRFGESLWRPFAHASGVLWLEVTGLFFAVFALGFGAHLWQLRTSWRAGTDHWRFLLYALLTLLFGYFGASSFYRARRKEKRRRA